MTHLFVWRDFCTDLKPKTYAITAVNMGDKPAAAITQTALRKTAEEAIDKYPQASKIILNNSYMDDIPGSVKSQADANEIMEQITTILADKSFNIKKWRATGTSNTKEQTEVQQAVLRLLDKDDEEQLGKVLGLEWDTENDMLRYSARRINLIKKETTKRECLSTIYSIFDPLGLLTPIIVTAKILLRKMWAIRLNWDEKLPLNL